MGQQMHLPAPGAGGSHRLDLLLRLQPRAVDGADDGDGGEGARPDVAPERNSACGGRHSQARTWGRFRQIGRPLVPEVPPQDLSLLESFLPLL